MSEDKASAESKENAGSVAPPKVAAPNPATAEAKGAPPTADPGKKAKKGLPPPANPPPQGSTSAAAAFRAKSALPPPSGPPPNGPTASSSVAKIRGAARPPSGTPPSGAPPQKSMGPPPGAPPPKGEAKAVAQPVAGPSGGTDSVKADSVASPREEKPQAKRTAPPTTRPPSAGAAKPTPTQHPQAATARSLPVDILDDNSPALAPKSAAGASDAKDTPSPSIPPTSAPTIAPKPAAQPKPVTQPKPVVQSKPVAQPPKPTSYAMSDSAALSNADNQAPKSQIVKKSTMEVLNDTTASLTSTKRASMIDNPLETTPSTTNSSSLADEQLGGVYTSKMGKVAQYSGLSRPNAPEEEVLVVKKVEAKPATDADAKESVETKLVNGAPEVVARSKRHQQLDDSFDDVEEIPFLDETKPEAKTDSGTKASGSASVDDDRGMELESKHGPPKSGSRPTSSHAEAKKEHKADTLNHSKDADTRDDPNADVDDERERDGYADSRKLKRHSPRDDSALDSFSTQSGTANGMSMSSASERKESRDSEEDFKDSAPEEPHSREKAREKRKERRRQKHDDEPKKLQAQFFNPKSVPYVPDHLLEFVKKPLECGRGHIVKCFIERNDSGSNKLAPIYTLLLEVNSSSGRPIMYARKKAASRITSHYVISMNKEDLFLSRMMRSHQFVGKLRSSTNMMEYCLYDQGDNPEDLDSDCEVDDELRQSIRAELAVIRYHNSKKSYARKMEVAIPSIVENGSQYLDWRPLSRDQMMEEHVRAIITAGGQNVLDTTNFVFLHKRETKYDPLSSCIVDFRSRATCVSVKNFQLVHSEPANEQMKDQYCSLHPDYVYEDQGTVSLPQEHVLLQLGKVGKDCFNMDFQYPLSMLQAFAISLSRFDTKQR